MNKFSWYEAKSIEDALEQVNSTVSKEIAQSTGNASVIKAGGVDLMDMVKEGLIEPKTIVHVRNIPGLDRITYDAQEGLRIGANTSLAALENDKNIQSIYLALHQSVAHAATPQIRNAATIAGNIAQRTRCWYFRSAAHQCRRKGGGTCFARNGENENHAILDNQICASVHASSIATALLAFDAKIKVVNSKNEMKEIPIEEFFVSPEVDTSFENVLASDEMIIEIQIPPQKSGSKSCYIKQGARESYDWSMADVAVVIEQQGSKCKEARITMGSAAPTPIRSRSAEKVLAGQSINEALAIRAALAAVEKANPLAKNAYKVPLFESLIKQAILKLV